MSMLQDRPLPEDEARERNIHLLKFLAPYIVAITAISIGLSLMWLDPNRNQPQVERGPEFVFVGLVLIAMGVLIALPDRKTR